MNKGNILNNFAPDDLMVNIARLCFGANMSTTSKLFFALVGRISEAEFGSVPLENYVCREVIEEYFFKDRPFSQKRHVILTASVVFSTMASESLISSPTGLIWRSDA